MNIKMAERQRGHWMRVGSEHLRLGVGPFADFAVVIRMTYRKDRCAEMRIGTTAILEMRGAPIEKAKEFAEAALERALRIGLRDLEEPPRKRR